MIYLCFYYTWLLKILHTLRIVVLYIRWMNKKLNEKVKVFQYLNSLIYFHKCFSLPTSLKILLCNANNTCKPNSLYCISLYEKETLEKKCRSRLQWTLQNNHTIYKMSVFHRVLSWTFERNCCPYFYVKWMFEYQLYDFMYSKILKKQVSIFFHFSYYCFK